MQNSLVSVYEKNLMVPCTGSSCESDTGSSATISPVAWELMLSRISRVRFYGGDSTAKRYKRRPNIYLFRPEDLDNDDVISAVESTPTYKRTREILDSINSQATGDIVAEEPVSDSHDEPVQGTIKFFS